MLEALGFRVDEHVKDVYITFRKDDKGLDIVFDLKEKFYEAYRYDVDFGNSDSALITPDIHMAITEKMKELGWIE